VNYKLQLLLFLHFLCRFIAPLAVGVGMFFAKKAGRLTTHYGQDPNIQRYVLPKWLSIFNTPDEEGWPMYEETISDMYYKRGWRFTMWYNLGLRNQTQGLLWLAGKEVSEDYYLTKRKWRKGLVDTATIKNLYSYESDKGLSTKVWNLGLFSVVFSWEVAHDHYKDYTVSGYYAIPDISFTK
jgi:hypothetical protein